MTLIWDVAGAVTYLLSGSAPSRVLTIQWANAKWDFNALGGVMSFQLKLYETTNVIEFVYQQESGAIATAGGGASIGITPTGKTGNNSFWSLSNASASPSVSSITEVSTILTNQQPVRYIAGILIVLRVANSNQYSRRKNF
jgi:hypothetical protein